MRPIDADALRARMYHEAFETDTDMQKWDSGCWIRYKLFENCIDEMPTISPDEVRGVGKWIPFEPSEDGYAEHFQCSNCNTWYQMPVPNKTHDFDFCPNCGARLEVSEDA